LAWNKGVFRQHNITSNVHSQLDCACANTVMRYLPTEDMGMKGLTFWSYVATRSITMELLIVR
jgi:hypothetical protein